MKKGKIMYVPAPALECLGYIEKKTGKRGSQAFIEMTKKATVGLELDRIESRFFLLDVFGKKKRK